MSDAEIKANKAIKAGNLGEAIYHLTRLVNELKREIAFLKHSHKSSNTEVSYDK